MTSPMCGFTAAGRPARSRGRFRPALSRWGLTSGSAAAAGRSQDELLLHELVHVKQHDEGRLSGVSGEISHPTDPHEQEAERSARQAVGTLSSLAPPADAHASGDTTHTSRASGPISRGILDDVRAAGAEIADLGGDAFMALARSLSPTLARLIEEGPGPLLREQVLPALEGWARALLGDLDPLGAVTRLQESLGGALALLGGALTGDPACCTALATLVDAVREMAQSLMESPIVQELQQLYGALSAKLALMIRVVAEPVFEAVKDTLGEAWGKVTGLADTVKGWVDEAQTWIGGAYDWLLEKLGLPPGGGEGGVRGWLMGHMNELWAEVQERLGPLAGPVKVLAAAAVALSPMGPLVALVTFGPQLIEIVSWLWAHKDDPDIVASAHEELGHTMLPGLLDGITQLRTILGAANEWLSGMFQAVNDAVNEVLGAIAELPIVKAARESFEALSAMADSAIQWVKDTFGPAVTQAQEMASAAMEWARPIIEVASVIPQALYPPNIPRLLVGWGWRMMPDCYKGPIIDLLLDAAIVYLSALPVIPGLNDLWTLLRPGVLGFLKGVKAQTLEVKIAVSDKIAKLLTGASLGLAIGFVKGLLLGLWEGLTDPFKLLWSLGSGMVSVVGWLWRQATSVVATVTQGTNHDAGAPAAGANTTLAQSAQALRPPAETIAQNAIPAAAHAMSSGEGMTFDGLIQWISGLWSSAQSAIASAGGSLADGLCKWFSSDGAESQIGESIGWLVGTILFEVALAVLTAGSWVAVGPTMQLLLRLLDWPGEVLGVMAKVLGKLGGALFAVAQKIGGMFAKADGPLKRVLEALFELGAALRRAADGLFGKVLGRNGDEVLERGAREVGEELGEQGAKHADDVAGRGAREAGEELGEQGAKHVDEVPDLAAKRVVAAEAMVVLNALEAAGQPVQAILLALRAAFMPVHPWIRNFVAEPRGGDWQVYLLGSKIPLGVLENANFAQKTYGPNFTPRGALGGRAVKDVVSDLKNGVLSVADLPIDYIVRNGNTLILNTRSATALELAGIPRSQWLAVNRTGDELFEERLTGQLTRNRLTDAGIKTVRSSQAT